MPQRRFTQFVLFPLLSSSPALPTFLLRTRCSIPVHTIMGERPGLPLWSIVPNQSISLYPSLTPSLPLPPSLPPSLPLSGSDTDLAQVVPSESHVTWAVDAF